MDALQSEILVLPYCSDERPLRGAAGLVDWRLCGALSRKLMAGYLGGRFGDKALLASPGKIKMDGLLLIGLGPSEEFGVATAEKACALIASSLTQAGVSTAAVVLPGRSMGLIPSVAAMRIWLAAAPAQSRIEEIIVIERAEEHRSLASLIDGLRRQAESPLG